MRSLMMKSCSGLALAGALAFASAAQAQSFDATGTFAFGAGNIATGFDETTVVIDTQSAVIDWTPNDNGIGGGDIVFQPFATTTTYDGMGNYVVLNRITPADTSRAVLFEGLVQSFDDTGGIGGTLFFYSPGGIVIGQDALFDVGSLGLTTAEPLVDGNGDWLINDQVVFQQADPNSFVSIENGVLSALEENSFIALFAPSIDQRGEIAVNGQAALVAGEAGTITFSPDGLFDIEVTVGTDGGIAHNGITGGPESSGPGDNHRVFMVAVPKANAINMTIFGGSEIGFDVAGGAVNDGDAVILSAGFDVVAGAPLDDVAGGGGTVDLDIFSQEMINTNPDPILFRSLTQGFSSGQVLFDIGSDLFFDADAEFFSNDRIQLVSRDINGSLGNVVAQGSLFLAADDVGLSPTGVDTQGASIDVSAGASLNVAGDLILSARGGADSNGDFNARGGQALLRVHNAGTAQITGDLIMSTDADPIEFGVTAVARAGEATLLVDGAGSVLDVGGVSRLHARARNEIQAAVGGQVSVDVAGGGTYTTGELNLLTASQGSDGPGGAGGGSVEIEVQGTDSILTVLRPNETGDATEGELDFISTSTIGGTAPVANVQDGGSATAGQVTIRVRNDGQLLLPGTALDPLAINLRAQAGDASASNTNGGIAQGGDLSIILDNANATLGHLAIDQSGTGGSALAGLNNVGGGDGTGGSLTLNAIGADATLSFASYTNNAEGGAGADDVNGLGGTATGGAISISAVASTLGLEGDQDIFTVARGGMGGVGGGAQGGAVSVNITSGSQVDVTGRLLLSAIARAGRGLATGNVLGADGASAFFNFFVADSVVSANGFIDLRNEAFGGNSEGLRGGTGTGDDVRVRLSNATIQADVLSLLSVGNGGSSQSSFGTADGASGTSGNAFVINEGGVVDIQADVTAISRARSGGSGTGGGNGADSFARAAVVDGTLGTSTTITGNVNLFSDSNSNPANAGQGGNAFADGAQVISVGGDITINGTLRLDVERRAGAGFVGSIGGSALGTPFANIRAEGANITVTGPTTIENVARGGDANAGAGGSATAGNVQIIAANAPDGSSITLNSLTITNTATGGNGGDGGAGGQATGGLVEVFAEAQNGELTVNSTTSITADSLGGNGGDGDTGALGGNAIGANIVIGTVSGGQFPDAEGFAVFQDVNISVNTTGGNGGTGTNGAGGNGGDATSGGGDLIGRGAPVTVGIYNASSVTTGGAGGDGSGGAPQGNGGNALAGSLDVIFSNNSNGNTRGNLTSGDIFLVANAFGGQGEVQGTAFASTDSRFDFAMADATLDRYSFLTNGIMSAGGDFVDGDPVSLSPNEIILIDADVNAGEFNFSTLRDVSLMIDDSTLDTVNINISVGDIVAAPAIMAPGLLDASNSLIINSMGNILLNANLVAGNELRLGAPGEINVGQLSGSGVVSVNSLGLITIDDDYSGDTLEISAADLVIGNDGGLNATSVVSIISIDPDGITVGAGLDTSTGFVIDDVMLGTVNAPVINLVAGDATALNGSIVIDTIDLGILPQAGIINFTAPIDGTVSVFGNLTYSEADPINVGLIADLVTINSDTGGVNLDGPDNILFIEGRSLYVGEAATLDALLLDNVLPEELPDLLATPTAIARPDGVLNAPNLIFQLANEIYIQNTGTAEIPAGFVSTVEGSDVVVDDNNPDPPRVIVNGQFETDNGTLTGDDAANAIIEPNGGNNQEPSQFTEDSTINGCLFTTGCEVDVDEPDAPGEVPPEEQATNTVNAEVQVVNEPPAVTTPANSENAADAAAAENTLAPVSGNDGGGAMGEALAGEVDAGSANDDFAFEEDPVIADSTGESTADSAATSDEEAPSAAASDADESSTAEADETTDEPTEEQNEEEATEEEEEAEATEEEEEEAEEEAASGPIMPPVSLFSTTTLDNAVDVNDPVSSAGNPALLNSDIAPPADTTGEAP